MLNRLDLKTITTDCGAELRRYHVLNGSRKGRSIFAISVDKDDAGICRGRPKREGDGLSGMEANARTTHYVG